VKILLSILYTPQIVDTGPDLLRVVWKSNGSGFSRHSGSFHTFVETKDWDQTA